MALICPYAKRADTEFYIVLMIMNTIAQHFYQLIDFVAAPIVDIGKIGSVCFKGLRVVYLLPVNFIRIKVIVHVYAVDVVVIYHIQNHLYNVVAHLGYSRIELFYTAVSEEPARLRIGNMTWTQRPEIAVKSCPVRIEPCVQLHTPFVTFLYSKFKRIKTTRRSHSLLACQPFRPWLKAFCIKGIGGRAHL